MPSHWPDENAIESGACVVYLVLSHTNPDQVRRLVGTILSGSRTAQVLVHHDEFASRLGDAFADEPRVNVLRPDRRVEWGDFSQVEAVLRSMRWALAHLEFDWLCFISGQDYPLQPLAWTERELAESDCDALLQPPERVVAYPDDWRSPGGEGVRRYFYRYWKVRRRVTRRVPAKVRRAAHQVIFWLQPWVLFYSVPSLAEPRLGIRRPRLPFSAEVPCLKGSEAGSYSRRCVEAIVDFVRRNPRYVAYFRRTISPSESFLPTIVWNVPGLCVHPDYRRFIRWHVSGDSVAESHAHPEVFRARDLPLLLAAQAHFGRKFDVRVDDRVLDLLDEHLEACGLPGAAPADRVRPTGRERFVNGSDL